MIEYFRRHKLIHKYMKCEMITMIKEKNVIDSDMKKKKKRRKPHKLTWDNQIPANTQIMKSTNIISFFFFFTFSICRFVHVANIMMRAYHKSSDIFCFFFSSFLLSRSKSFHIDVRFRARQYSIWVFCVCPLWFFFFVFFLKFIYL